MLVGDNIQTNKIEAIISEANFAVRYKPIANIKF